MQPANLTVLKTTSYCTHEHLIGTKIKTAINWLQIYWKILLDCSAILREFLDLFKIFGTFYDL